MALKTELSARTGYAANDLDRQSERREDAVYIRSLRDDPEARTFVISGDNVVLERDRDGFRSLFTFAEAARIGAARETVFLGHDGLGGVFAIDADDMVEDRGPNREQISQIYQGVAPVGQQVRVDLRTIAMQAMVSDKVAGRLAQAKSVLYWHQHNRFCANCGAQTRVCASGWRRECDGCKAQHFPRTDPVVIMLAVDGERCLLGRQPRFPSGMYSALAGFVEGGETLEDAVRREIKEEAGLDVGAVRYLAAQPWPFPHSLMIGCLAQAATTTIKIDEDELEDARWFSREETLALIERRHPTLFCPPKMSVAHHLLAAWARDDISARDASEVAL